ncbi:MAG: elongation factor 1-beta [Crenarchaeota archaeon]|nr:elongation factor 1-beta [Thermoproteota archaeon]
MAKVLVLVKVYPSDININLDELAKKIEERLPEGYKITRYTTEPIAFGLNALKLYIVMPEETEGGTSKLEELIAGTEGVDEVEVEAVHRLSEF